uniref:Uncharacterized protein n=1 Tax=Anguilla anguilla TaxID=7936 RepID=A0A0E9TRP4_ANGAN
MFMEDSKYIVP